MITRETVLVLGAGASGSYGFPLGSELRRQILAVDSPSDMDYRERRLGVSANEYTEFREAFLDSGLDSIDSFLSKQAAKRAQMFALGKRVIALYVGRHEKEDRFRLPNEEGDWYRQLWNAMALDIDSPERLIENKLKVLTFNYDRSLEFFLYKAARSAFHLSREEALELTRQIPIRHVYGDLGRLGFDRAKDEMPYEPLESVDSVTKAAENIRLMAVERDSPEQGKAVDWFKTAAQVCFLGFGFDSLNVRRLGFKEAMSARFVRNSGQIHGQHLHAYATVIGIPPARVDQVRAELALPGTGTSWHGTTSSIANILPHWNCLQ
jgi:hypothetical protein